MRFQVRDDHAQGVSMTDNAKRRLRARAGWMRRPRTRAGFTIVEMIVAIMVFTIGVLGLAGTAAYVARQMNGGMQQTLAATIAQSRIDSIAGTGCRAVAGGTATNKGISERWTVDRPANFNVLRITEQVTWTSGKSTRTQIYTASFPC
jgi:prepilin-type N-terminal cleavage/methylation domain-containing protein